MELIERLDNIRLAIVNNNIESIRSILNDYPELVNMSITTYFDTPLILSTYILYLNYYNLDIRHNIKIIIKIILEYNPNVNLCNNGGFTALFNIISLYDEINIIDDLIYRGANVNLINRYHLSIFNYYLEHIANNPHHTNVLTSLLKAGLIIDTRYIDLNLLINLNLINHLITI